MCAIITTRLNGRRIFTMNMQKRLKNRLKKAVLGCFFVFIGILCSGITGIIHGQLAYAVPDDGQSVTVDVQTDEGVDNETKEEASTSGEEKTMESDKGCKITLGPLAWLACSLTEKVSDAVDWLYEKIEGVLVINPIPAEDGSPIYEIWKYCRGLTNIVFIIFLLVVIYSQLTGIGISNYGIKKVLPKLIVAAVLVNVSFLICSLAVDVSNTLGNGLRGLFSSIAESAAVSTTGDVSASAKMSYSEAYSALAGGTALAVAGGVIAFEAGAIWMLIPTALGAAVAVLSGLITIAMRQAVVALLIMISPLAMVAYMLPNTEGLFKKWKKLLTQMLVFYPMFSLLFGASQLAGYAIIASAKDGFGLLLGMAVQVFPLFFSWSLMKMSGTILGTINSKMHGLAARPLASNRAWAESHRQNRRARALADGITPSARLMQFMSDRRLGREAETAEKDDLAKVRAASRRARSFYDKNGVPTRKGEEVYADQARKMRYQFDVDRHDHNMNKGLGQLEAVKASASTAKKVRLGRLDIENVKASDDLKAETARGAEIEYENAIGFFRRSLDAQFAEGDRRALLEGNDKHQMHPGVLDDPDNLARYERWKEIMEGQGDGVQTILADAASSANAQGQIRRDKFKASAFLTPATQNVADHIGDLVNSPNVTKNIDAIIGGLRILNMRGDTDMVAKELEHHLVGILTDNGNINLGTYASQALANYAMFDVKDNDPVLRRFGKYINMQTAAIYNDGDPNKRRKRKDVSWWEYVNSGYVEHDENGNVMHVRHDEDGNVMYDQNGNVILDPNGEAWVRETRGMRELMLGTSYSGVERTAFKSQREGVRAASYEIDRDGRLTQEFSVERYFNNMDNLWNATLANIIGDQFSYRSGSEQITALARDITGVGKDGKWDWKYIFGDELQDPSLEQKAEFIMRSRDLTKKFLGGHVPSQIARSKTDMLQAIRSQYALFDEVMRVNERGEEEVDLERLQALEARSFEEPGSYDTFLREKKVAIKRRFQASFKDNALRGFVKQFKKGYQGEAKDLLIELLDPETLYDQYYPYGERQRRSRQHDEVDDEDDGMSVDADLDGELWSDGVHNDTRERLRRSFERYSGNGAGATDVEGFWNEASSILGSSVEMGDMRATLEQFEEGVPQYTDIAQLYTDIIRTFFGSE